MHSTNSFLYTLLERIRGYLDDTDVDGKYSNDYIIRHIICPSMVDVLSRLNNTIACPIINKFTVTLDGANRYYDLPPCVQEVLRLVVVDPNTDDVVIDAYPRDRQSLKGPGWSLEGSPGCLQLYVDIPVNFNLECQLWYVSNGSILPHYSTGGILASSGTTFTLATSATLGVIDRRENAYVGQILRLLPADPDPVEERIIDSHTESSGVYTVTPRTAFTKTGDGSSIIYEIAPAGCQPLYEAIALWSAMKLGVARKISANHYTMLSQHYKMAMKTIGDNLTNMQTRRPTSFVKDTVDNPMNLGWGFNA